MNTGFSWVRIDKGNIHCNFRRLNIDQVETVVNYLLSYYEYKNVTAKIIDLGATGVLDESGDHYRPSGADPAQDYYFLVELHRHGTIIPQGCIEIMKSALNALALHQIIPESVFIQRLKTNSLVVDDERTLTAISTKTGGNDITWASSEPSVVSITPDGANCDIVAHSPGSSDIEASVQVPEEAPLSLRVMSYASDYWTSNVYKYIGSTVTFGDDTEGKKNKKYYGIDGFEQDHYYECVFDAAAPNKYKWVESEYDGSPVMVTYRDIYTITVMTYIKILTKSVQRICLYHSEQMQAFTPSTSLLPNILWTTSSDCIEFDGGISTGESVMLVADRVGSAVIKASISDAFGTYEDSQNISVYAIDATPTSIKMITGSVKSAYVAKKDIFSIDSGIVVDWITSNSAIALVESVTPEDETTNFAEAHISAQGVGQVFITAVVEDPTDGTSYSDTVKVTVGNVAINVPESAVIWLLGPTQELTLTCALSAGFTVGADGWTSGNPAVVEVTQISGTDNNTVTLTGLTVGTSLITVTGRNGSAVDTDQILITVTDAEYVTAGEMSTFTHGMYNGHGVIDWDHPTGEEGAMDVDNPSLDLATEEEVDEFVDDLFKPENSTD